MLPAAGGGAESAGGPAQSTSGAKRFLCARPRALFSRGACSAGRTPYGGVTDTLLDGLLRLPASSVTTMAR